MLERSETSGSREMRIDKPNPYRRFAAQIQFSAPLMEQAGVGGFG
jgi:hypothetical protein